jgi:hypothetical protein
MYKTKVIVGLDFVPPDYQAKLVEFNNESSTIAVTELDGGQKLHERTWIDRQSADAWCAWALAQTDVVSAVVEEVV